MPNDWLHIAVVRALELHLGELNEHALALEVADQRLLIGEHARQAIGCVTMRREISRRATPARMRDSSGRASVLPV
jgi:hypothetical protein